MERTDSYTGERSGAARLLHYDDAPAPPPPAPASQAMLSVLGSVGILTIFVLALVAMVGFGSGDAAPSSSAPTQYALPVVVNTWWPGAANATYQLLARNFSALDAAMAGCESAEESFAFGDHTVGPDGSPDFTGETTLDALLCDGATGDVGAVAYLRRTPSAIRAARAVMRYTRHSLLAGDGAADLASYFGAQSQRNLSGPFNDRDVPAWREGGCQPNYYDPAWAQGANASCGPYVPRPQPAPTPLPRDLHGRLGWQGVAHARNAAAPHRRKGWATVDNHDTLGLCALDVSGSLAAGVTSNGAHHKVAGRVGDAPVIGAGGYASNDAGGCAAVTGDGDITQRFLPSFVATENMRRGMSPQDACEDAVRRIMRHVGDFAIGIVCLNSQGQYAAASHGWAFTYCAQGPTTLGQPQCSHVTPLG